MMRSSSLSLNMPSMVVVQETDLGPGDNLAHSQLNIEEADSSIEVLFLGHWDWDFSAGAIFFYFFKAKFQPVCSTLSTQLCEGYTMVAV